MLLSILISVLKVAGIVILVILGLFLLILLTVLLVPVRYSFEIKKPEEPLVRYKADYTWLLSLIHFSLRGKNTDVTYRLRIAWLTIMGEREAEEKPEEELPPSITEDSEETARPDQAEAPAEEEPDQPEEPEKEPEAEAGTEPEQVREEVIQEVSGGKVEPVLPEEKEDKEPLIDRIVNWLKKTAERIRRSRKDFEERIEKIKSLELDVCIPFSIRIFKKVIKHIFPQQLEGEMAFGSDDPVTDGRATAAAALLYPLYGETFVYEPHFERKILTADCRGKGRIRFGFFLIIFIEVMLKKQMRTLIFTALRK